MNERLALAFKHLRDVLQEESHEHCVAVNVFFNSQGYEIEYRTRTPVSLRRDGVTMRNLRGEWVE